MTAHAQDSLKYAVGPNVNTRLAPQFFGFPEPEQTVLFTHGIGVSLLRSSAGRWFWNTGVNVSWFKLTYDDVPDFRYTELGDDVVTVGTRDETIVHRYASVPLYVNYKLLNSKAVNVYLRGGGILDYLYHVKINTESTYDGKRSGTFDRGFATDKFSKTIQLGIGLYLPIRSHFAITLASTYGYTFLNDREKKEQGRNGHDVASLDFSIVYQLK